MLARRSDRLLNTLKNHPRVLVVAHDFPDPDAIATGWALLRLIRQKLASECRLVAGGDIVRAENREMVRLLSPPIELVTEIELLPETATVLVDCSPAGKNHLLSRVPAVPTANLDHHRGSPRPATTFCDVRPNVAATVSIAAGYLQEQQVEPGKALATAMLYAIRTETQGYETHFSSLDRAILPWITERADPSKLAEIQNAPLPRAHFSDLVLALQNTFLYDNVALCLLPQAEGPETVAEVADLLVRCEGVDRVLCAALVGQDVMLSLRTTPGGGDAAQLVRMTLEGLGGSGGHEHRAGGKIAGATALDHIGPDLQQELRKRWLSVCGVERKRGTRLIAKREIVSNL